MGVGFELFGDVRREPGKRDSFGCRWSVSVSKEFQDLDVVSRFQEFTQGVPH
jgi:hypothetical protein